MTNVIAMRRRLVWLSVALIAIIARAAFAYELIVIKIGGDGGVNGQPEYTDDPECLPDGAPITGPPPWYVVPVTGVLAPQGPCNDDGCHAPPPTLTVELFDCDDNQIASETHSLDDLSCEGHDGETLPPLDFNEIFVFSVCGGSVKEIVVTTQGSRAYRDAYGQCVQSPLEFPPDGEHNGSFMPADLPLNGTLAQSALDCLRCELADQPTHGRLQLHKSTVSTGRVKLFSLAATDGNGGYGETVNGEFHASLAGQLIVETGDGAGAIEVWGGTQEQPLEGWFAAGDRQGTGIAGRRTVWWNADPAPGTQHRFRFHLRTFRGRVPSFPLRFHWYTGVPQDCCIRHEIETLDVEVLPLPCERTAREPAVPQYRVSTAATDNHIEVRLPCCPACVDGEACTPGDTTGWFVTWPRAGAAQTAFIGQLLDGHANGWRLDGNTLWAPSADGLGYEFLTSP